MISRLFSHSGVRIQLLTIAFLSLLLSVNNALAGNIKITNTSGVLSGRIAGGVSDIGEERYATVYTFDGALASDSQIIDRDFMFPGVDGVVAVAVRSSRLSTTRKKVLVATAFVTPVNSTESSSNIANMAPRASSRASGPRVSVGGIRFLDYKGKPLKTYADSSFIFSLVNAVNNCGKVVVDPVFDPAFKSILKELNLKASHFVDPNLRQDFGDASQLLQAQAPQYRLTGTVSLTKKLQVSGVDLSLVDTTNNEILWHKGYVGSASLDPISQDAGGRVWETLCRAKVPLLLSGDFMATSADGGAGTVLQWSGTFSFQLQSDYETKTYAELANSLSVPYILTSLSAHWNQSGGSICQISAQGDHVFTLAELGVQAPLQIKFDQDRNLPAAYFLALGATYPQAVPQHWICPSSTFDLTISPVILLLSSTGGFTAFQNNGVLDGSHSDGIYAYQWSLRVQQSFNPPD